MPSPVAPDASATTHAGQGTVILVSPSDPDTSDGESDVQIGNAPAHGSAISDGFGQLTYIPDAGFTGTDTFTYSATDDLGSAMGTVSVTVTNTLPQAAFDFMDARGGPISIPALGNDWDADGDTLSLVGYSYPTEGTVFINGDVLEYDANPGATGTDTFSYQISDGNGGTATGTVTVLISENAEIWSSTGSTDFDADSNWLSGRAPDPGDQIFFLGSMSQIDCTNMHAPLTGSYTGVTFADNYNGTVTSTTDITTSLLELDSGNINQPGTNLTVTDVFNWTGGTLNSGDSAAVLHLVGATGTIAPVAGGTVSTGDTLSLEDGSTGSFLPGTINFLRGDGVDIHEFCSAQVKPAPLAIVSHTAGLVTFTGGVRVRTGGTLTVAGPGFYGAEGLSLRNEGGTVEIQGRAVALFGPNNPTLPPPTSSSIAQTAGTIRLHSGATLGVSDTRGGAGIEFQGGNFTIVSDSPPGDRESAKLQGGLAFRDGTLSTEGPRWTFEVTGSVLWTGGSYRPKVDLANKGLADIWQIDGALFMAQGNTATIQPESLNIPSPVSFPVNFRSTILIANFGFLPPVPGQNRGDPLLVNTSNPPIYALRMGQPNATIRTYDLLPAG